MAATAARHFPMLVTNGWLVSPARARAVWEAGLEAATVSMEDALAERHDALTGVPGSHARAVSALETLARERTRRTQRLNVRTRLRGGDLEPLERVLELASPRGATVTVEAAFPLPVLNGDASGLVSRLRELGRRHPHLRSAPPALSAMGQAMSGGVAGCLAGRAFFNVDHRGRVSKCVEFRGAGDRAGRASLGHGRGPEAAAARGARRERLPGLLVRLARGDRVALHRARVPRRPPDAGHGVRRPGSARPRRSPPLLRCGRRRRRPRAVTRARWRT